MILSLVSTFNVLILIINVVFVHEASHYDRKIIAISEVLPHRHASPILIAKCYTTQSSDTPKELIHVIKIWIPYNCDIFIRQDLNYFGLVSFYFITKILGI